MLRKIGGFLAGLAVVGLIAFSFWTYYAGPCWMFNFTPAKDVPGRCVMVNK